MSILNIFFKKVTEEKLSTNLEDSYNELVKKYDEAFKFYCFECKRGFDRKIGKMTHMRWKHSDNPPIVSKQTELVQNPVSEPVE